MSQFPSKVTDYEVMSRALDEMKNCHSEPGRVSPSVAAAVVLDGEILAIAHRGELSPGQHAEFTLLEGKLSEVNLTGATLFTTLEPCTDRNDPKVPCATRIVDRGISKVWIGMLDPNPDIRGKGILQLRDHGIDVQVFPGDLMSRIEISNTDFMRLHRRSTNSGVAEEATIGRDLDRWYLAVNQIYGGRNAHQPLSYVFAHLVEVIGGLSTLASEKKKASVIPADYVQKAVAWWLALCGRAGVSSPAELVWRKFPGVCPYCERVPHDDDVCRAAKALNGRANWGNLFALATEREQPKQLSQWLMQFRVIYPVPQSESYGPTFARLSEELGELAEAIRLFDEEPRYFLSEAADVFAWIMRIENIRETKAGTPLERIGITLNEGMARHYPDFCLDCDARPCRCPVILKRTIGRIASEIPDIDERKPIFMAPDERRALFMAD